MSHFEHTVRVYYEDTDAGGVTYYANYLKFFERARTEWLRSLGFEQQQLAQELGIFFVVRRVEADYLQSARLDDELQVSVQLEKLGRVALVFMQEIRKGSTVLARCRTKVACVGEQAAGSGQPGPAGHSRQQFAPRGLPEAVLRAAKNALIAHPVPASDLK